MPMYSQQYPNQSSNHQSGYTQQQYGQPQYGQPQYGQPQYGQSPYGGPPQTYPPQQYQQQYQQTPQTPQNAAPQYSSDKGDAIVNQRPKYNDVWAAILYLVHLIVVIALAAVFIRYLIDQADGGFGNADTVIVRAYLYTLSAAFIIGSSLTGLYLFLVFTFPKQAIVGTVVFSIILYLVSAAYSAYRGIYIAAAFGVIFAIITALFLYFARSRIAFSAMMLQTVVKVMLKYLATLWLPFITFLSSALYYFMVLAIIAGADLRERDRGGEINYGVLVFLVFSIYWTAQVLENISHVTISGVFASYYFLEGSGRDNRNPTLRSLKRALTWSFGSICFGSLIIAIFQTIRFMIRSAQSNDNAFVRACADCILGCIQNLIEYFNTYAFAEVAIYGKGYVAAAKDTWALIKSFFIDAIINDNLIGSVLGFGTLLVAIITGMAGYFLGVYFLQDVVGDARDANLIIITILAVLFGGALMFIGTSVIRSGVVATFVCLAEDPAALARTKPELYNQIVSRYPRFASRVSAA